MTHYTKLTSEKYLVDSMKQEVRDTRQDHNEKAVQAFTTMACVLAITAITLYSAMNVGEWITIVKSWM